MIITQSERVNDYKALQCKIDFKVNKFNAYEVEK